MAENRVVEGRMVTPHRLAELIEDGDVLEVAAIEERSEPCPECGETVLTVEYMPSITELVEGSKCQECAWSERTVQ